MGKSHHKIFSVKLSEQRAELPMQGKEIFESQG
jgi:hypothetical protein